MLLITGRDAPGVLGAAQRRVPVGGCSGRQPDAGPLMDARMLRGWHAGRRWQVRGTPIGSMWLMIHVFSIIPVPCIFRGSCSTYIPWFLFYESSVIPVSRTSHCCCSRYYSWFLCAFVSLFAGVVLQRERLPLHTNVGF